MQELVQELDAVVQKIHDEVRAIEGGEGSVFGSSGETASNVVPFKRPGAAPTAVEEAVKVVEDGHLKVLQDRLVAIIDDNYQALHDSIEKLKCKGNCYKCPHPEFPTVAEQVKSCLSEVVEGLDLDRGLISP